MKVRTLLLVFALALPVLLLIGFPLRLALELVDAERTGLSARAATGSVWNGQLHDASLRGMPLGDAATRLAPLSLFTGTAVVKLTTPGLSIALQHGRRRGLDRVDGSLPLSSTPLLPGARLLPQADELRVLFTKDTCHAVGGRLTVAIDRPDGTRLVVLQGAPACEGRAALLPLAALDGSGPLARMQATARIHPDGQWELEARVPVVDDPTLRPALEAAGFQPGPAGWSRVEHGRLD